MNFFKILFIKKIEIINKIIQKQMWVAIIFFYWFMMPQSLVLCIIVKSPVLGLQRAPENSVLAPSFLVLYGYEREQGVCCKKHYH